MPTLYQSRSSMFKHYSYNEAEKILSITFSNGGTYDYFDVPLEVLNQMDNAESQGKYFLAHVKPKFKCEKK